MPPKATNQYDFIMNEQKKSKGSRLSLSGNSNSTQKLLMMVGLLGVIIMFFFVLSFISGRSGEDKVQLKTLLQQQVELNRVAGLGSNEVSTSQALRNTSVNVLTVTTSDNQALIAALAAKKITFKPKDLAASTVPATDKRLADAKAAANFSSMYISILNEQLVNYQSSLQQTYDKTKSKSVKESLSKSYAHAQELKKQVDAIQP
jgi:hypothetical protein